jgi:imidazolonepropionase-like amidohydrolase
MADGLYPLEFPARLTGPLAVTRVTVVPMDAERVLPDHTVIVEDGRIRALAPSAQIDVGDAVIVDGSQRWLMPGLADMHVHYHDPAEFALHLANGVTTVRNMWGAPLHLALRQKVERGELPGPRMVTTSPIVDGPGADGRTIWPGSTLLDDPSEAERLVRRYAERGYQQIKAYSWLSRESLHALGRAAAAAGVRITGHCPNGITFEEAIAAGMSCFEHLTGIAEGHLRDGFALPDVKDPERLVNLDTLRATSEGIDFDAVRRLGAQMAAAQVWNCPTLVVYQQMSQDRAAAMADPRLRYVPPARIRSWDPANDFRLQSVASAWDEWLDATQARIRAFKRVLSILHEEGAPLLVGTDTPNPFVFQGFAVHDELANFVDAGMRPYEALRCATVEPARFLGESTEWGTVEQGKRADLLLLSANPLNDVGALRAPEAVLVNGFHFTGADLARLLEQRATSVRTAAPLPSVALGGVGEGVQVVREGTLVERVSDGEVGCVAYRHLHLPDGRWIVEERYANGVERSRRTSRLSLRADLTVERAEYERETTLGEERCELAWSDAGRYEVRLRDVDGAELRFEHDGPALVPSEQLAFTVMPLLIARAPAGADRVEALSIDGGEPRVAAVAWSPAASPAEDELAAVARIMRHGQRTEQHYRVHRDGALLALEQVTWMGRRELVAST